MQTYKIEIDEKVWNYLKAKAEPFDDTPNSVLNRLLFGVQSSELHGANKQSTITNLPTFSDDVPKALAQILEVVYAIKRLNLNRREATKLVARKRNKDYQTIIDKYCRQLGMRAYEIDRFLEDKNLEEFRALLKRKFVNHLDLIDSFFKSLNKVK